MASNVLKIQKTEKAKMFLWAHNGHTNLANANENDNKYLGISMGGILKKVLDTNYYSIGFVFNQGSFQALTESIYKIKDFAAIKDKSVYVKECSVPVSKKNTLTNELSTENHDAFFIDLNSTNNPLFTTLKYTYDCGAMIYKYISNEIIAKNQFDGLIYINKTRRAVPIK